MKKGTIAAQQQDIMLAFMVANSSGKEVSLNIDKANKVGSGSLVAFLR